MAAHVKTAPAIAISGTATRSARPTARGPRATMNVARTPRPAAQILADAADPPKTSAQTDAAIVLLTAIHAKLVT